MVHHDPSPLAMGAVVAVVALGYGRERAAAAVSRWRERRAPSALEALKEEYAETDMTHEEFSRRVDQLMEPGDEEIAEHVEQVGGVGETIANEVAVHFESLEHVRRADLEELQKVPDVGPSRAESIARFFE